MVVKQSNESKIKSKSFELLKLRKIDLNIENEKIPRKELLFDKIDSFQRSIFRLDEYGESNWIINNKILSNYWEDIFGNFSSILSVEKFTYLFNDILNYQAIELDLRKGNLPLGLTLGYFYHLKTCDIRLIRNIIRIKSNYTQEDYILWNYYDIINEINDDISDLLEDKTTFNCNRIIISVSKIGAVNTFNIYYNFLLNVRIQLNYYLNSQRFTSNNKIVFEYCHNQILENINELAIILFDLSADSLTDNSLFKRINAT